MEELTAVGFRLFVGIVVLAAMFLMQRKPETPAQARRRLYREASAWDKEIHKRTQRGIRNHLNPRYKTRPYVPNKARIRRRMREMAQD